MSRMYKSCSWRTPAHAHAHSPVHRADSRPDTALSDQSACHSDGTRPQRFIKDSRLICPITRRKRLQRSYREVQTPPHSYVRLQWSERFLQICLWKLRGRGYPVCCRLVFESWWKICTCSALEWTVDNNSWQCLWIVYWYVAFYKLILAFFVVSGYNHYRERLYL